MPPIVDEILEQISYLKGVKKKLIRFCPSCSKELPEPLEYGYFLCENCQVTGHIQAFLLE